MDRGWYFGQPSEKEGRRSTTLATQKNCSQQDRIKTIHRKSSVEHIKRKVTARTMQNIKTLDRTERNVKMCLFSLTLRYFQAYNLFKKQKLIVCGNHDLIGGEGESIPTMERIAMEEEESNARTREQIIKEVNSKALRGYHRMHLRREYQQSSKVGPINKYVSFCDIQLITHTNTYSMRFFGFFFHFTDTENKRCTRYLCSSTCIFDLNSEVLSGAYRSKSCINMEV